MMIKLYLEPEYQEVASSNLLNSSIILLAHQEKTYKALTQGNDLVINYYNTGTGKTLASLLYLKVLNQKSDNVLFIAPTNELIFQHAQDIQEFVDQEGLSFHVIRIDAAVLRSISQQSNDDRKAKTLHQLMKNPYAYKEQLHLRGEKNKPFIMVTNPDIFYYALFQIYHPRDSRNLFEAFVSLFQYIIIDEFHYYNSKQFAAFLFFFILSEEFGYFRLGRKICLLSATPAPYVDIFLDRLKIKIARIDPKEEEIIKKDIQTLSEAKVFFLPGNLESFFLDHREILLSQLKESRDGAIISNSLKRINYCYSLLNNQRSGRITGPQTRKDRDYAISLPLIFATPTVDIGYNFKKIGKKRQNLDFIIFEAGYLDELIQRLGRVGRLLGKEEFHHTSFVYVLLREEVYRNLENELGLDEKSLSRKQLPSLLEETEAFPQREYFSHYINSGAIMEVFHPIYRLYSHSPVDIIPLIEKLFLRIKEVFGSRKSFHQIFQYMRSFDKQKELVLQKRDLNIYDLEDYSYWLHYKKDLYGEGDLRQFLEQNPDLYDCVKEFVHSQFMLKRSLFSFRDSFNGPLAAVYDPKRLFSDREVCTYDLFHFLRSFDFSLYPTKKAFLEEVKVDIEADYYLLLKGFREELYNFFLSLEFQDRDFFEDKYCNRPIALKGFEIVLLDHRKQLVPIPKELKEAIKDTYLPLFIVCSKADNALERSFHSRLKGTAINRHQFKVDFTEQYNEGEKKYYGVIGTASFLIFEELRALIYRDYKMAEDEIPIII